MKEFSVSQTEVLACIKDGRRVERSGHQGSIYVGTVGERKILIKAAAARGATAWMCRWMLRREYDAYRQLTGIKGIPQCYGLINGRYLVLEYIDSQTMRHASIKDRQKFFEELFAIIQSVHERGVGHGDLKRKDNILVADGRHPFLIDFGISAIRNRGFHPLSHLWHNFSHQHDLNAWVKHKYDRKLQDISPEDAKYYRPMRIEQIARVIKRTWVGFRSGKKSDMDQLSSVKRYFGCADQRQFTSVTDLKTFMTALRRF